MIDEGARRLARQAGVGFVRPESFGASPNANATQNTNAIQTALNIGGHVYLGSPGTYQINQTLIIGNNTALELGDGVTIQLAPNSNCNMLNNSNTASGNTNIRLTGGTWDYNGPNQSGGNLTLISILLNNVTGLTINHVTAINTLKYAFLVCNITNLTANDITFNTTSDGFHMQGPITRADIRNLKGTTGDDMLAMTVGDYASYDVSQGNFQNIVIDGMYPNGSLTCVKIAGNGAYIYDGIVIRNLNGTVQNQGVFIENDTNLTMTNVESIIIENVDVVSSNNEPIIQVSGGTSTSNYPSIQDFIIKNIKFSGNQTMFLVENYATINRVTIENIRIVGSPTAAVININGTNNTIGTLVVDKAIGTLGTSSAASHLIYMQSPINEVFLLNSVITMANSGCNAIWQRLGATINVVNIDNVHITGTASGLGHALFNQDSSTTTGTIVMASNVKVDEIQSGFLFEANATLQMRNVSCNAITNVPVQITGPSTGTAINVRVLGSVQTTSSTGINFTNEATASVNGADIPVDITKLTPEAWDTCNNINASATVTAAPNSTAVTGTVIYDGGSSTWRHM